jgi:hypothetical protein
VSIVNEAPGDFRTIQKGGGGWQLPLGATFRMCDFQVFTKQFSKKFGKLKKLVMTVKFFSFFSHSEIQVGITMRVLGVHNI